MTLHNPEHKNIHIQPLTRATVYPQTSTTAFRKPFDRIQNIFPAHHRGSELPKVLSSSFYDIPSLHPPLTYVIPYHWQCSRPAQNNITFHTYPLLHLLKAFQNTWLFSFTFLSILLSSSNSTLFTCIIFLLLFYSEPYILHSLLSVHHISFKFRFFQTLVFLSTNFLKTQFHYVVNIFCQKLICQCHPLLCHLKTLLIISISVSNAGSISL